MREILFRGKRKDNGEWIEGDLTQDKDLETAYIQSYDYYTDDCGPQREPFCYEVLPETVGQLTGIVKDGKKIFEGDIGWDAHNECYGAVEFQDGKFVYVWENACNDLDDISVDADIDFIGNIYDNPELLGGKS